MGKSSKKRSPKPKKQGGRRLRLTQTVTPIEPPDTLPFPPQFDMTDLVTKYTRKRLARFPNEFIIYRSLYVKYLKERNHNFSMTDLAPIVSKLWRDEPENVKTFYKKVSLEARKQYLLKTRCDVTSASKKKLKRPRKGLGTKIIMKVNPSVRNSSSNSQQLASMCHFTTPMTSMFSLDLGTTSCNYFASTPVQPTTADMMYSSPLSTLTTTMFDQANYVETNESIYSPNMLKNVFEDLVYNSPESSNGAIKDAKLEPFSSNTVNTDVTSLSSLFSTDITTSSSIPFSVPVYPESETGCFFESNFFESNFLDSALSDELFGSSIDITCMDEKMCDINMMATTCSSEVMTYHENGFEQNFESFSLGTCEKSSMYSHFATLG
ncbi:3130_t:CDS:1 [Paraglomus brasilianum]|uniref:3130_t:CDS:1 n=1 Tax=Paraglomus brasilianum TaxID=144538 RepID=A0A9N8YWG8_9GLOM|nr:3130_t:CDS:1 [Paraglomus brasilianum]